MSEECLLYMCLLNGKIYLKKKVKRKSTVCCWNEKKKKITFKNKFKKKQNITRSYKNKCSYY